MPNVTVTTDSKRFDLQTALGAYIEAKPLSYGQKKDRADIAGRVYSEMVDNARNNGDNAPQKMFIESANRASTLYDFQHCIVGHNFTDANERALDFKDAKTLDRLDPRVGTEVEDILAKLNGDDETPEQKENFTESPATSPTPKEKLTPSAA